MSRRLGPSALEQVAGAALIASIVLVAVALVVVFVGSDASTPVLVLAVAATLGFVVGMFGLRRRATEQGVRPLLIASAMAMTATVVGTTVRISGVALGVPVAVITIVVIARSEWKLGDTGIFAILVGSAAGAAYLLAAALHPNTGSYGDQGAIALVSLGVALSSAAVALMHDLPRGARLLLAAQCVLAAISTVALMGAMSGGIPLLVGLVAATLGGAGWICAGIHLWRNSPRTVVR
ncbi:MAG: hypothetical protein M3457_11910 [Chloroflexota bacterium]|nr:hypothetical protein [Chloroflexota bacterium]